MFAFSFIEIKLYAKVYLGGSYQSSIFCQIQSQWRMVGQLR